MKLAAHSSGSLVVFGQTFMTEVRSDRHTACLLTFIEWLLGGGMELEVSVLARLLLGRQNGSRPLLLSVLRR